MTYRKDRQNGAYVCCGYVKHGKSYCSSHIIEERILLQTVKDDLKELISKNVKLEKLNEVAVKKASHLKSSHGNELASIQKQLNRLNKQFQNLLQLYSDDIVTKEQFQLQNEHISKEQTNLNKRKLELEVVLQNQKDIEQHIESFKAEVRRFTKLDINDEKILKQVLQRLIQKLKYLKVGKLEYIII